MRPENKNPREIAIVKNFKVDCAGFSTPWSRCLSCKGYNFRKLAFSSLLCNTTLFIPAASQSFLENTTTVFIVVLASPPVVDTISFIVYLG